MIFESKMILLVTFGCLSHTTYSPRHHFQIWKSINQEKETTIRTNFETKCAKTEKSIGQERIEERGRGRERKEKFEQAAEIRDFSNVLNEKRRRLSNLFFLFKYERIKDISNVRNICPFQETIQLYRVSTFILDSLTIDENEENSNNQLNHPAQNNHQTRRFY